MKIWEIIFFSAFSLVGAFVITMATRDHFKKRKTARSLTARPQHDDEAFARAWFPDPKQADIAIRTRRVLASNLKMPLKGLKPTDKLNDDLNAELEMNPHLFWELEEEFAIKTGVDDLETFEKTLARLVTFEDLVKFLEEKISSTPPNTPAEDENEGTSRAYQLAMRAIPVLFIGGFAMLVVAILVQKRTMINLGGMIFLSGLAVWGFGNGGELLRGMIQSYRGRSWKEIAAHPWWLMFQLLLLLFFLYVGAIITWGVLKGLSR